MECSKARVHTVPSIKPVGSIRSSDRPKFPKEHLHRVSSKLSCPQFGDSAKKNLIQSKNNINKKRKGHSDLEWEPIAKRARIHEMNEAAVLKLNSSKTVNLIDKVVDDEDEDVCLTQPKEKHSSSQTVNPINNGVDDDDEDVCLTQPTEAIETPSVNLTSTEPVRDSSVGQSPQSTEATVPIEEKQKSKSCSEFTKNQEVSSADLLTQEQSKKTPSPCTKSELTNKSPKGLLPVSLSVKNRLIQVTGTARDSDLNLGPEAGSIFVPTTRTDQFDGEGTEHVQEEQQREHGEHGSFDIPLVSEDKSSVSIVPQPPVVSENISEACSMTKQRKVKIKEYYTSKIEELYDKYCTDSGKDD